MAFDIQQSNLSQALQVNHGSQLLVSIIINNYNYARFLIKAIDSALNQTYKNVEIIVVDDGSVDASVEVIKSYSKKVISVLKGNGGQASAINAGFAASHGEIIVLLDADDYLFPYAVENIIAIWKPEIVQIQSRLELVDVQGNHIDIYPKPEIKFDSGEVLPLLLKQGRYRTTVTSGLSFSRAVLFQILPIPEPEFRISADGYLVTVAPFYGQVASIEKTLGARCYHDDNLWISHAEEDAVKKLRRFLDHDLLKHKFLLQKATELDKEVHKKLGFKDHIHLAHRIASLRLDPVGHSVSNDSRLDLAWAGYWAVWQYSKFSWLRKLILSSWFVWVGLLPLSLAKTAINWLFFRRSRSVAIARLIKLIRRATV